MKTTLLIIILLFCIMPNSTNAVESGESKQSSSLWIQPLAENQYKLCWGFKNGIRIGLTPGVIRGLVTIHTTYEGQNPDVVLNFIAIEPIPKGERERGFSELEKSDLDDKRGKRIWTSNDDKDLEPKDEKQAATGIISNENGIETLTVFLFVEPFNNQAKVYLQAKFYANNPQEVEITTYARHDSKELENCIVTATMGNYARLRNLYLKEGMVSSHQLWPDYTEHNFAPHQFFEKSKMITGKNGYPYFIASPDEKNPQDVSYVEGTARHWMYKGSPLTQYWYCKDADNTLQGIVNARVVYWASHHAIPGGISCENFEMKKQFKNGDRFVFGISPLTAEKFIDEIK